MTDKSEPSIDQGPLAMSVWGKWQICVGTARHEISSGEVILLDVSGDGEWKRTRIEHSKSEGGYYSVDGYPLRDGMLAALPT